MVTGILGKGGHLPREGAPSQDARENIRICLHFEGLGLGDPNQKTDSGKPGVALKGLATGPNVFFLNPRHQKIHHRNTLDIHRNKRYHIFESRNAGFVQMIFLFNEVIFYVGFGGSFFLFVVYGDEGIQKLQWVVSKHTSYEWGNLP